MVKLTELKCWRWLPGMRYGQRFDDGDGSFTTYSRLLWDDNKRCLESHAPDCGARPCRAHAPYDWWKPDPGIEPDLTDPATQGAIVFGLLAPMGWEALAPGETLCQYIEAALRLEG
jgi:hypothetical protein